MIFKRILTLSVIFSIFLFSVFSEAAENEKDHSNSQKIVSINFSGLKKTKDSYIKSKFTRYEGENISDFNQHDFETALQKENLFDDIKVSINEISENECSIEVSVKEKITFLPLPFASYSSSGILCGAVILDTNAFGVKDTFMFGGFYSNSSVSGMFSYSKAAKEGVRPGISFSSMVGKNTASIRNINNDIVQEYSGTSYSVSAAISQKLEDAGAVSLGIRVMGLNESGTEDKKYSEIYSHHEVAGTMAWRIEDSDWNGWFLSTNSIGFSYEIGVANGSHSDRIAHRLSGGISLQKQISERLRFLGNVSGFFGYKNHVSNFAGRGAGSVTILPGSFRTERIYGGSAGLEMAVFKGKYGLLSLYGLYEAAFAQDFKIVNCRYSDSIDNYEFCHGFSSGLKIYLSKISFPAVALGSSYNVTKNQWQFAAAMGVSF